MNSSIHMRLVLSIILIILNGVTHASIFANSKAFAVEQAELLPVDEAYVMSSSIDGDNLLIQWKITDGYYLYKERFKFSYDEAVFGNPIFEYKGVAKTDPIFGDVTVFYNQASIRLPLLDKGVTESLVRVTYQGCAEAGLCYPPQTKDAFFLKDSALDDHRISSLTDGSDSIGLAASILFAFLGGLILNLMPCVFPVLSLKALKFSKAGTKSARKLKEEALFYTLGVVALFIGFAIALIAFRSAGETIGWGFQLQTPWFVGLLAYLLLILGLALLGVIEVGSGLMGIGEQVVHKGQRRGAFFTGVLAVLVASPCTAPFMGPALGYALTQPTLSAISVFFALGLGMASPFLILAFIPVTRTWMPKPGSWMENLKQFLAFPMFLSVIWLVWVFGRQTSQTAMAGLLVGMLALVFGIWVYQKTRGLSSYKGRLLNAINTILCAIVALTALNIFAPSDEKPQILQKDVASFSKENLRKARGKHDTVLVNITADWCITCLVNEQTVLSQEPVLSLLKTGKVHYMKGDLTHPNAEITHYLESFGRHGVPLYVVYRNNEEPDLLPQILTTDLVMNSLNR